MQIIQELTSVHITEKGTCGVQRVGERSGVDPRIGGVATRRSHNYDISIVSSGVGRGRGTAAGESGDGDDGRRPAMSIS